MLNLGDVTPFDELNSFYRNHSKQDNLSRDCKLVIMVTHYVTIKAVANIAVPSAELVLYDLDPVSAHDLSYAALIPRP